jgi:hypothetical protein
MSKLSQEDTTIIIHCSRCTASKKLCNVGSEQHIAIDEGIVPWKGRLSFRQYLPNKPDRFGIKLYQLSESKSGYICDFEVYTGKDSDPNPDGDEEDKQLGHSYNVVLGLLRNNNLFGKGYTVYTDNYYSSPAV